MAKLKSLREDYPKEVPLIESLLSSLERIEAEQKTLRCQVNALINYHRKCARHAANLIEDISKCPKP